jgi:hypothetical protein
MINERAPEPTDCPILTIKCFRRRVDRGSLGLFMVTDPEYEHAKEVKQRYASSLMALERVVGVGVSKKPGQAPQQSRWVIVVYVSKKMPPHQIDPGHLVPKQIEGVPTDVVEAGQPIPYNSK